VKIHNRLRLVNPALKEILQSLCFARLPPEFEAGKMLEIFSERDAAVVKNFLQISL
jgi:hypothetical protein